MKCSINYFKLYTTTEITITNLTTGILISSTAFNTFLPDQAIGRNNRNSGKGEKSERGKSSKDIEEHFQVEKIGCGKQDLACLLYLRGLKPLEQLCLQRLMLERLASISPQEGFTLTVPCDCYMQMRR